MNPHDDPTASRRLGLLHDPEDRSHLAAKHAGSGGSVVTLSHRFDGYLESTQAADAIVSMWKGIEAALDPIVGQKGLAMLYRRALCVAASAHPWLAELHMTEDPSIDLATLRSVLVRQPVAACTAGGNDLLKIFEALLSGMIGTGLTNSLLSRASAYLVSVGSEESSL